MQRRVIISGVGPVCSLGLGMEPVWQGLTAGKCPIGPIQAFDAQEFDCTLGANIGQLNVKKFVPKTHRKATKVMARDIQLAVIAADLAARDAQLKTPGTAEKDQTITYQPHRLGAHIGAGLVAADLDELTAALYEARNDQGEFDYHQWGSQGISHLTPLWLLKYLPNMLACHVTIIHDARGPSNTITCSEASGGLSLGESLRVIRRGAADLCFCGGTESKLNPMGFLRQIMTQRINTQDNDTPMEAVRPFSKDAAGTIVGEGGGIVIIESQETFAARSQRDNVSAYGEIVGFGASQTVNRQERNRIPDAQGVAIASAIRTAMHDAQITPGDIDLIVPFGLGYLPSDQAEANALHTVFGGPLKDIPICPTKSMTGACAAGASALDICITAQAMKMQTLPAVINCQKPIDGLNAGSRPAQPRDMEYALTYSSSLGGQNAAVVIKRYRA